MITSEKITANQIKWTSSEVELLLTNDKLYELVNGDLYIMTRSPRWEHQNAIMTIGFALSQWSLKTKLGKAMITPGIVYSDTDNVIPDLVWISQEKLANSLDESGHLTNSPELIVEVLSYGKNDVKRDKEIKLKLYSAKGVIEYWIVDWKNKQVEIYRRNQGKLELVFTLFSQDKITTPLLPELIIKVADIFI
jgi:Uma2 family endonuclease